MLRTQRISLATLFAALFILSGCTNSSSDDNSNPSSPSADGGLTTNCGIVIDGSLSNTTAPSNGVPIITFQVLEPNLFIITTEDGSILVQLHGINSVAPLRRTQAISRIRNIISGQQLYFFQATPDCTTTAVGGGTAAVGNIVTSNGTSITEFLLEEGFANEVQTAGLCGESSTASCYQSLSEIGSSKTAGTITRFLWKPVSERDGNLVVLASPLGATILVNGQQLVDFGPSNGYGTTARTDRPGCSFGNNITVQVLSNTGVPYSFPSGSTSYTVNSGCNRQEFQG